MKRGPAAGRGGDDRVGDRHHGGRDQDRAGHVNAMAEADAAVVPDQEGARDERGRADRHVDEEDPVPARRLGQEAAGQEAQRAAAGDREGEHAHRLRALVRARKGGDDHGDDHPGRERAAQAL